jgi:hypothetical protein
MFGKFNIFGGNKNEEVTPVEKKENNEPLVQTGQQERSQDPYAQNYVENVEMNDAGVARPHDVHMAKNEAMMKKENNQDGEEEQKVDIAA